MNNYKDYLNTNEIIGMFNLGIEKVGDCYFFKSFKIPLIRVKGLTEYNKSEIEKDINEIYLNDYLLRPIRNERAVIIGYFLFEYLYFKLKNQYPNENFRVILTYDLINPERLNTSRVLFYKKREGYIYLDENLNGYKTGAVAYIDTMERNQ